MKHINDININYYKSIYHVCRSHTGYNNGHESNVKGFARLQQALDFIDQTKQDWTSTDVYVKLFGGKGCAASENNVYKLFSNVEKMNQQKKVQTLEHITDIAELLTVAVSSMQKISHQVKVDTMVSGFGKRVEDNNVHTVSVCVAGSVMFQTLGAPIKNPLLPSMFDRQTKLKLELIENIRRYDMYKTGNWYMTELENEPNNFNEAVTILGWSASQAFDLRMALENVDRQKIEKGELTEWIKLRNRLIMKQDIKVGKKYMSKWGGRETVTELTDRGVTYIKPEDPCRYIASMAAFLKSNTPELPF